MGFKPYPRQAEYLQSEAKYRLIQAANQSVATVAMARDAARFAMSNPGSHVLLVGESLLISRDTTQNAIMECELPVSSLRYRNGVPGAVERFDLNNDSSIRFMSFDLGRDRFHGIKPDAVYFDGGFYENIDGSIPDLDILSRAMISGSSITLKVLPLAKYRRIFDMFSFLPGVEIFKFGQTRI